MWEFLDRFPTTIGHVTSEKNPADLLTKFDKKDIDWNFWLSPPIPEIKESDVQCRQINPTPVNQDTILQLIDSATTLKDCENVYTIDQLVQAVQHREWKSETNCLIQGQTIPQNSSLGQFRYEVHNGILMTRLRDEDVYARVMLPRHSPLVKLIVEDIHRSRAHMGGNNLHLLFSERYFSPGCRQIVRSVVSQCYDCTRMKKNPQRQVPAPLAAFRYEIPPRVFAHCGVDFAGPMTTTSGPRYVILFNCLHSRAISIKLLRGQTAKSILQSLLLHASHHGPPLTMYSDNASVFVKADKVLTALYEEHHKIAQKLNWKFSFPGDPASNGVTESMIGVMKRYLAALTFDKPYTADELEVYLAEVQRLVNNRPLFVCDGEVITPQHFISGGPTVALPHPDSKALSNIREHQPFLIRQRAEHFWNAWKRQDLVKRRHQQALIPHRNFVIGDFVFYETHNQKDRSQWPIGQISNVYPGRDGNVRSVDIKLDGGEVLYRRPVAKLVRMEQRPSGGEAVSSQTSSPTGALLRSQAKAMDQD